MTRIELIEHIDARRVTVGVLRGDKAHVTVDHGKRTEMAWVPRDWIKPLLDPSAHGKAGR